jgi:hypothetical protein
LKQRIENDEDMGLKLKKDLELSFCKKNETNYCSFSTCIFCIAPFTSDAQRTFVAFQFTHPITQKSLNLVKGRRKILKNV